MNTGLIGILKKLDIVKKDLAPHRQVLFSSNEDGMYAVHATLNLTKPWQTVYVAVNGKTTYIYKSMAVGNSLSIIDLVLKLSAGDDVSLMSLYMFNNLSSYARRV